jgi:hypothetical protein
MASGPSAEDHIPACKQTLWSRLLVRGLRGNPFSRASFLGTHRYRLTIWSASVLIWRGEGKLIGRPSARENSDCGLRSLNGKREDFTCIDYATPFAPFANRSAPRA